MDTLCCFGDPPSPAEVVIRGIIRCSHLEVTLSIIRIRTTNAEGTDHKLLSARALELFMACVS